MHTERSDFERRFSVVDTGGNPYDDDDDEEEEKETGSGAGGADNNNTATGQQLQSGGGAAGGDDDAVLLHSAQLEVDRINREYEQRLRALDAWRAEAIRSLGALRPGSAAILHAVGPNQYHVRGGRTACTCIALVAIASAITNADVAGHDDRVVSGVPWGDVVSVGANLYHRFVSSSRRGAESGAKGFVHCHGVFKSAAAARLRERVCMLGEFTGHVGEEDAAQLGQVIGDDGIVCTLRQVLSDIRPGTGVVLTAAAVSVAVFRVENGAWWIYDSHGGGRENTPGCGALIEAPSVETARAELAKRVGHNLFSACLFQPAADTV
jgi:hypothetical protein